ncbi:DegT/DnrJ/EryC1/StrS family aminotransferase [Streptomyces dangxiongensis]|uniref:DegT/DnrJ/EryC1/StrS family aminotransferase n=1 Tax=Streptomyces dangxiongensis TaxID=1442032 RepID=UPI001F09BB41|nr:DegT/DnrJ/EryC1/StrS family aminotransferase [Streptomyces dangxiongensis]
MPLTTHDGIANPVAQERPTTARRGERPAFDRPLQVGSPNIPDRGRLFQRISQALDRGWLTNNGPLVREFEDRLTRLTGAAHVLATSNGTSALEVLARARGLTGEVIVPSFTYVATAHALQWQGLTPVFADIDPHTGTLDPAHVRELITERTSGIVGVHLWGRICRVDELRAIADEHGLALLYDGAHALGCELDGRAVGGFGDGEILSFHATKFINAFEGGAVLTNDPELAERVGRMRNFGFGPGREVLTFGTNAKMNEISAAMGLTALEHIDEITAANALRYEHYRAGLLGVPGVRLRGPGPGERGNDQYVVVEIDAGVTGVHRDRLLSALHEENVFAQKYFHPGCHRMRPYAQRAGLHTPLPLPGTEALAERVLVLPSGPAVTPHDVDLVCELVRQVLETASAH